MTLAPEQSRLLFCDLLALVSAGARGEPISITVNEWEPMLRLAHEHNVLPLFACALLRSPDLPCPESIREYALNVMRNSASVNTIRRKRVLRLLGEMETAGFDVKLLKGYTVARYYAFPESRDSVDTDIWIREDQEVDVYAFFEKKGFQTEERSLTSHHGICQHKKYGKIEVHTRLYDEIVEDVWFKGIGSNDFVRDNFEKESTPDGEYATLGATDQLIFLTLHMIKHFIDGGLSIRMMLDVALHYTKRSMEIDTVRFWSLMNELRYAGLVSTVLVTMSQYAGFDESVFAGIRERNLECVGMLLDDLMSGGYMGIKEQDVRLESGMEYNRQLLLKDKNTLQYNAYMLWWKIRSGFKFMFPSTKYLRQKYSVLEEKPVLMPVLWLYQMIAFPIKKVKNGVLKRDIRRGENHMNEESKQRIELFRKLGML